MGGPQGRLCATAILLLDREREHDTYWEAGLVQLVTITCPISCGHSRCVCHDLGDRLRGPIERMRLLIPFHDELGNFGTQLFFGFEVGDS
jgi:hypothetical protein